VLNEQLAISIARLNFGHIPDEAALPFWDFSRKTIHDPEARGKAIQIAKAIGLHVPRAWAHEALDIPMPNEGEEILVGADGTPAPGGGAAETPPDLSPEIGAVLARMPLDAREYFLARFKPAKP
jgi:phage gp29-like protein